MVDNENLHRRHRNVSRSECVVHELDMTDTIDLICPNCKKVIFNICLLTVDWIVYNYCRDYVAHVKSCHIGEPLYGQT
jgi:hypothetical protein